MKKLLVPFICILVMLTGCAAIREAAIEAREASVITADEVDYFSFSIGGFGEYNTYSIDKRSLQLTVDLQVDSFPRSVTVAWTEEEYESFISGMLACGVTDWDGDYIDRGVEDGTQWRLTIKGEFEAIEISGSNAYPDGFDDLLNVLSEYSGMEVK